MNVLQVYGTRQKPTHYTGRYYSRKIYVWRVIDMKILSLQSNVLTKVKYLVICVPSFYVPNQYAYLFDQMPHRTPFT
jgi:hypothetical protein